MGVFLHGLELKNYRGIGPEPQMIAPFGNFNIFVGANNSGKSTVLDFIHRHLPAATEGRLDANLSEEDKFRGKDSGSTEVLFGFPVGAEREEINFIKEGLEKAKGQFRYEDTPPNLMNGSRKYLSAILFGFTLQRINTQTQPSICGMQRTKPR